MRCIGQGKKERKLKSKKREGTEKRIRRGEREGGKAQEN